MSSFTLLPVSTCICVYVLLITQ